MKKGTTKTTCQNNKLKSSLVTSSHQAVISSHQANASTARQHDGLEPIDGEPVNVVGALSGFLYGTVNQGDFADDAKQGWVKVYQQGVAQMLLEQKISGGEAVVLFYCISCMTFRGRATVHQRQLASDLGLAGHASLSRALKSLEKKGILSCVKRSSAGNIYRVNPAYAWRGKDEVRTAVLSRDARRRVSGSNSKPKAGPEPVFSCPEKATA